MADELSTEQKRCFDAAMSNQNLFISGPGGVGKSFVLKSIIEEFRARGHKFRIAASTGVAALNVGGSTIHSLLGTRLAGNIKEAKEYLGTNAMQKAQNRLSFIKTIIVDEVSMLSGDYITMMDFWLQQVRGSRDPFGGLQIIFCGDFLQLPPVEKGEDKREYRFAIDSPSWERAELKTIDLERSYRQEDQTFVNALNRVRFGEYTKDIRKVFRPCIGRELEEPTHLVATNKEADQINFDKLKGHPGEAFYAKPSFAVFTKYSKGVKEKMVRNSLTDSPLCLKIGVPVLLLKNHREGMYVNGSRGIVKRLTQKDGQISSILITLDTGEDAIVEKEEWQQVDGDQRVQATMTHFPVRLGWALTIHKSQGLTLDNVEIDLSRGFACGQAYVALSRMRSLEGLSLTIPIDPSIVRAEPRLVEFYDKARVATL